MKKRKLNKGSSAPKTYYYVKDIAFLAHEPLLEKFREFKVFIRKLKKAIGKEEGHTAQHLEANKPVYTLDHIVKERWVGGVSMGRVDISVSVSEFVYMHCIAIEFFTPPFLVSH